MDVKLMALIVFGSACFGVIGLAFMVREHGRSILVDRRYARANIADIMQALDKVEKELDETQARLKAHIEMHHAFGPQYCGTTERIERAP